MRISDGVQTCALPIFEADYSLVSQTGDLSSISVTAPARINFYALGSESGLENTFLFGALSHTEADYAYDPTRLIGSADFTSPGSFGGLVFMSDGTIGRAWCRERVCQYV